jgi:D-Tyr-tRNAtyr deacylase
VDDFLKGKGPRARALFERFVQLLRSCGQETLEEQLAGQLRAVEIPDGVMGLVRQALKELHGHEKAFRDAAITALRRRQDEIQKKQDILLDRLLDGTVAQDMYNEKYTALQNEKAQILVASNATLEGQKARLNLRPAFAILAKTGPRSNWLRG